MKYLFFVFATLIFAGWYSPAHANTTWCKMSKAPDIIVVPRTDNVRIDTSRSHNQLGGFTIDTVNPYGAGAHTEVGGLMEGEIEANFGMQVNMLTNGRTNQTCVWYDKINVDIKITPVIYIAREYPRGSCMFNAVYEHELKHVNVDRQIVNKYVRIVGEDLKTHIAQKAIYGPFPANQLSNMQQQMQEQLNNRVKHLLSIMEKDRLTLQQQVDSLEEYERVRKLCPQERANYRR